MKTSASENEYRFLSGGGEMGDLIRLKDWSVTPLGPIGIWPQSLKTILGILLNSKFPMFLFWGPELICFYNDAYRPSLGKEGKHPSILGMNGAQAWTEIWHIIEPLIGKVVGQGEAVWFEDHLIPIYRNGKIEDVYWTFSYSPIPAVNSSVDGVLVTCTETTDKVNFKKQLQESEQQLKLFIAQAPVAIVIFRGSEYVVELANTKALEILGIDGNEIIGKPILRIMPELKEQGIPALLNNVYSSGERFSTTEFSMKLRRNGKLEPAFVNFSLDPLYNDHGDIDGIMGVGMDVTAQVSIHKAIENNEEKLNIVIEASELGIWELNLKTREVAYSKKYLQCFGYSGDEKLSHDDLIRHLHPDDIPIREKAFKEAIATGHIRYDSRLIWNDGSVHWFEGRGKVFYDQDGSPLKMIGTIRDITDLKLTEQTIIESEKRFRNLIMQSPVAKAVLKGKEFIVDMANEVILKNIWRKDEEEVIGKKIFDVFPELKSQKYADLLEKVYTTGEKYSATESLLHLKGNDGLKSFYLDFEYAPLVESDKSIFGIKITAVDVTEKVEARRKIEKSEEKFRLLADSMPQHIWTADTHGNLNYVNQSVFDYSGLTEEEIRKNGWSQIIYPEDWEPYSREWFASVSKGENFLFEHRLLKHNGEFRWHLTKAVPQKDVDGKIQMWVGTSTDIEDQKTFSEEMERQVKERTKELAQNNLELARINKELQSFTYISSHDLQEPLRKIQTFSSRLREKEFANLSENGKNMFLRMQHSAERMQVLIDDLLTYSRTDNAERKFEIIDIRNFFEALQDDLSEQIREKEAVVEIKQSCFVPVIPFQFWQLMQNLMTNALKFSSPDRKPHIVVESSVENGPVCIKDKVLSGNYCHITFSDNGIGFDDQYNEKIFEVFQRLHGREQYTGTGIGLAIVKKIVEIHNGHIAARGVLNQGATFDIFLPLHPDVQQ